VRYTRGTELIAQRSPLHVVQQALGHGDPRSTQVYADLSDVQLRHELKSHRR
jgi:site-specific recombinase XerD